MPITSTPAYRARDTEQTKDIVLVVKIDGLDTILSNRPLFSPAYYGAPGLVYGMLDLVYGGGSVVDASVDYRDILSLDGSTMTVSQKLEPEQGRASVSQFTLGFIDKDEFVTRLCTPGELIPDVLGAAFEVFIGYKGLAYPEEFLRVFRGYVTSINYNAGMYQFQLSDPNMKRRQRIFTDATTVLTSSIDAVTTAISVDSVSGFYSQATIPDSSISLLLRIDDELISYTAATGTMFAGGQRGFDGTVAVPHDVDSTVTAAFQMTGNVIDLALKLMLSGWESDWISGEPIVSLGVAPDTTAIVFPEGVDVIQDYGLVVGDSVTVTGAAIGNNGTRLITAIYDSATTTNNIVSTGATFTAEPTTSGTVGFTSQYNTFPVLAGLKLKPTDVDIEGHQNIKTTWVGGADYSYSFIIQGAENSGKTFIESELYLPVGLYSLTRRGLLSVGITKPPVGQAPRVTLNADNVLDPSKIRTQRAINNRKFFNRVDYSYDEDVNGEFLSYTSTIDSNSLSVIGLAQTLPIKSRGGRTGTTSNVFGRQANLILSRYKNGALVIDLEVTYGAGNLLEAGDVIILTDDGQLQIPNYETGQRLLGSQFFEVEDRQLDLKSGKVKLRLISGIGAATTDRFGIVSPSSLITGGSSSAVVITGSYGATTGTEWTKWIDYIGQDVTVHNADWTHVGTVTLAAVTGSPPNVFQFSSSLGFTPASGYIVDIPYYPTSTDPSYYATYKNTYVFADPQVAVTSGTSSTVFDVGGGDIAKFFVGSIIRVHNATFSNSSSDTTITGISGTTITVGTALGFTPTAGDKVELIGFADQQAGYRMV
jgi:hypothetical protein